MENVNSFLNAATRMGVKNYEQFQTVDLYEGKNIPQVVDCIFAVSRHAAAKGYHGPLLGPKLASSNSRNFTQEQLNESNKIIGLQMVIWAVVLPVVVTSTLSDTADAVSNNRVLARIRERTPVV